MHLHRILAIGRAARFSPNSVDKDAAILDCVCHELTLSGCRVETVSETELDTCMAVGAKACHGMPALCLTMGREAATLDRLRLMQARGTTVMNSPAGVALCCNRRRLTETLGRAGVPVPPETGRHGLWLKRADGVAESRNDVRFAANDDERMAVEAEMRRNGVTDIMTSAHVPGDLIKFYGVRGSQFFRFYYPGDDRQWKFGDEERNGRPEHYPFSTAALHHVAERAAEAADVDIYGGDCIVKADGSVCIIDFNDWPSFARCRNEAAGAIAAMALARLEQTATSKKLEKKII